MNPTRDIRFGVTKARSPEWCFCVARSDGCGGYWQRGWSHRPGNAEEVDEDGDRILTLLAAGTQEAHQPLLMTGSRPGRVAAPDLPVDHRWSERLFRHPVGRWQSRLAQAGEEGVELAMEVAEQPALPGVGAAGRLCQLRQKPFLQLDQLGLEVLLADLIRVSPIPSSSCGPTPPAPGSWARSDRPGGPVPGPPRLTVMLVPWTSWSTAAVLPIDGPN